jgi:glycosyltransferase involved in cell wall biosynthesis
MDISVIIPLYNESDSIIPLGEEIFSICQINNFTTEVIFVNDGSSDESWSKINELAIRKCVNFSFKGINFRKNLGKSNALNEGFKYAVGKVIITMDADLQDNPIEIPKFVDAILNKQFDLVSGWKKNRKDPFSKTIPTKLFNLVTRFFSGIQLHDFNCGFKAYKLEVVRNITISGEMHRYVPLLAKRKGYSKIGEIEVNHREREHGKSKFGVERFSNGFLDLLTILFLNKFGNRPMHFFGLLGIVSFMIGFCIAVYFSYSKLFLNYYNMTDRPLFFFGILSMIIGSQFFLTGFLAEMIVRNKTMDSIEISEKIGF